MGRVLAGDIGGTKTILGIFDDHAGPIAKRTYASRSFHSFKQILDDFLQTHRGAFRAACFGVAGPVVGSRAWLTNLSWTVDADALKKELRCPVAILNDAEAAAFGIPHLLPTDTVIVSKAKKKGNETKVVVAPGTGLGESILHWTGSHYDVIAGEGGHTDFAPRTQVQWEMKRFLQQTQPDAGTEELLSGHGLLNIYDFLNHLKFAQQNPETKESIMRSGPRAITAAALQLKDPLSVGAVDQFVMILAAEAQRLALTAKALGGVYLAGGIVPHLLRFIQHEQFMRTFLESRMKKLLEQMPVHVVMNEDLVLLGATSFARTRTH
jgi:glucokinase